MAYSLKEAAEAIGCSDVTIRRYIKSGKIKARTIEGKYGPTYEIDEIPQPLLKHSPLDNASGVQSLINRIEQLNQEVGYWRAKAEDFEKRVLLLEGPKRKSWWWRLFGL